MSTFDSSISNNNHTNRQRLANQNFQQEHNNMDSPTYKKSPVYTQPKRREKTVLPMSDVSQNIQFVIDANGYASAFMSEESHVPEEEHQGNHSDLPEDQWLN